MDKEGFQIKYSGMIYYLREVQNYGNNYVSPAFAGEVADALEEAAGGWHSVIRGAPEEYKPVLLYTAAGDMVVGYYDSEYKFYRDMSGFRYIATHWRELPAEPDI